MAESRIHKVGSDARQNRLAERFGQPCLHEAPFSVMLHKSIIHLLPTIYGGQLKDLAHLGGKGGKRAGAGVKDATIGGLNFQLLGEGEEAVNRDEYLKERGDDTESMAATTPGFSRANTNMTATTAGDDYFNARRKEFAGDQESPYELNRMNTDPAMYASTEQLIPSVGYYGGEGRDNGTMDEKMLMEGRSRPQYSDRMYSNSSLAPSQLQQSYTGSQGNYLQEDPYRQPNLPTSNSQSQLNTFDFGFGQQNDPDYSSSTTTPAARPIPPPIHNQPSYEDRYRRQPQQYPPSTSNPNPSDDRRQSSIADYAQQQQYRSPTRGNRPPSEQSEQYQQRSQASRRELDYDPLSGPPSSSNSNNSQQYPAGMDRRREDQR